MSSTRPTIFVQIASYRDPECQWTVRDLFLKAQYPEQITVGICQQWNPDEDQACMTEPSPRPSQTRVISVPIEETNGVCWARALTQTLFENQDFVLMIDSHMRFDPHWDSALINELHCCGASKPLLSSYPPGYKPPNFLEPNAGATVMRAKPFTATGDIRFDGEVLRTRPERPLRGAFLAAGLIFAPGSFVREVPYDPYLYFDHEEIMLAARAFTHGWDVFSPSRHFIYHYYYSHGDDVKRNLHWSDRKDWATLRDLSRARYNFLLRGIQPSDPEVLREIDRFGLGRIRTLTEYETFSGIDFKNRVATERALHSGFIEDIARYR